MSCTHAAQGLNVFMFLWTSVLSVTNDMNRNIFLEFWYVYVWFGSSDGLLQCVARFCPFNHFVKTAPSTLLNVGNFTRAGHLWLCVAASNMRSLLRLWKKYVKNTPTYISFRFNWDTLMTECELIIRKFPNTK